MTDRAAALAWCNRDDYGWCGHHNRPFAHCKSEALDTIAALPPDYWCGHEVSQYDPDGIHVGWMPKSVVEAEIARLTGAIEAHEIIDGQHHATIAALRAALAGLVEAVEAFVGVWGETEAMESSHAFVALRAALATAQEADHATD